MKKNLLTSVLAAFVLLAAVSCQKNSESVVEPSPAVSAALADDPNFISMSLAKIAAIKTGQMMHGGSAKKGLLKTQAAASQQVVLADSAAYPNSTNPSFYVFNYEGGGFVIIGADKRTSPIHAWNATGTFKMTGNVPPASVDWMKGDDQRIKDLRKDPDIEPTKDIAGSWSVLTAGRSNLTGLKVQKEAPPEPPCEDYEYTVEMAPLLTTQWGQGDPYNLALGYDYNNGGGRFLTGCGATAVAQVLYYWKKPDPKYNWASIISPPNGNGNYNNLSYLMRDAGQAIHTRYGSSGSWAYFEDVAPGFKGSSFSYTSAEYGNYDYWTLRANLAAHRPVVTMATNGQGNGHIWVCDGPMELTYWYCGTAQNPGFGGTSAVLHMNWGWSGVNDGYYLAYDWAEFTYGKKMVYDIHP